MQKIYFYITTPLYNADIKPHIGQAYTALAADVVARHSRARQIPVFFQTGIDEGVRGISGPAAASEKELKKLWKLLNINYDNFIRAADPAHVNGVRTAFEKLLAAGDIYPGNRAGGYCPACETFYAKEELTGGNCPRHAATAEPVTEGDHFFRLSKYADALLRHYKEHPGSLKPESRALETVGLIRTGLKDLPVSRAADGRGIMAPSDPARVIHPRFASLLSYITGPGYALPGGSDDFQMKWPADAHLCGRELLRSHAIIWPAALMALGLELPKMVHTHGRWLMDGKKISGSGNSAVIPEDVVLEYGADALRYFLFRETRFGEDGVFSVGNFKKRYNADLANELGNLFSRVLSMVQKYLGNKLPDRPEDADLLGKISSMTPDIDGDIDSLRFSEALDRIWDAVALLDKAIDTEKPWDMAIEGSPELKPLLHDLVWCLRVIAGWIYPFMPDTATKMQLGLAVAKTSVPGLEIQKHYTLFPRKE